MLKDNENGFALENKACPLLLGLIIYPNFLLGEQNNNYSKFKIYSDQKWAGPNSGGKELFTKGVKKKKKNTNQQELGENVGICY